MTPADLSHTVLHAVRRAVGEGALREVEVPPRVVVERPRPGGCGDWATNAALQLARGAGLPPRRVAEVLRERLLDEPGIARVDITGPGFLNLTLRSAARGDADRALVRRILAQGPAYGHGDALRDEDLHLFGAEYGTALRGEERERVVGDAVAALVRSQGGRVRYAARGERLAVRAAHYDVLAALGPDAGRWALLRPARHDRVPEPGALLRQTEDNPFFLVRYAHSRARALQRNARDLGFHASFEGPGGAGSPHGSPHGGPDVGPDSGRHGGADGGRHGGVDGDRHGSGSGRDSGNGEAARLVHALADHPLVLLGAARHRAPDRVARHLEVVADAFLGFQHAVLPRGDQKPTAAHRSRLALAEAAGTVLAGGLSLLGIRAPEHL
ncbi:ArgS-related anticodon-binding protein NrtL [Streptomyces sp. CC228A]|uniref:ArgS-related anticodon-binding protein NrtL n=1 Tax=Streptomyces sp. CC228A TaxID=2898186 RepID=UPI001F300AAB|nr:DALR anticodon-binding domain-containing protein [Streptomyces sp. CC228A]